VARHRFGGAWTDDKLERIRKYLSAYTKIFRANERARYYRTTYVDAFAGSGSRADSGKPTRTEEVALFDLGMDTDAASLKAGSARIALEVRPTFDHYAFVERNTDRAAELEALKLEFPERDVQIVSADANEHLRSWCLRSDWRRNRAVVFLDPYGMQVEWSTVQAIADTRAIDLWWLVPLGIGLNRLLTGNAPPPPKWADALTRSLGTEEWRNVFYAKSDEPTLFPDESVERRIAGLERLGSFFLTRLRSVFAAVAPNPLSLLNRRNTPIYLLCFAAGNPKAAPTAIKIAKDILGR